ncbi:MAG: DUF547 domain-containing protein, partial [Planctomycetota bacterium]
AVLLHGPLRSVTDVHAPIELKTGQGFFHRLGFVIGGRTYSLLQIENERIRDAFSDPRVHFVLNCASGSCPALQPELPRGAGLEAYLDAAAKRFVADPQNVAVDHASRRIRLSTLFEWYRDDFLNDLRRRGRPAGGGLVAYLIDDAPDELRRELERARDYEVEFLDYDWSINSAGGSGGG